MALKAMLILACVMAIAYALPAPEDQVELVELRPVVQEAQERGDLVSEADTSGGWGAPAPKPSGWGWSPPAKVVSSGWGWQPQQQSAGWGWPKFKYLKFSIPIPILPRIKFGIKGGLKLNAAIQHPKGWGWSR